MTESGDLHAKQSKSNSKKPNIPGFHSLVETGPKTMLIIIIMGHKCKQETERCQ
jgi:hypothetical protein